MRERPEIFFLCMELVRTCSVCFEPSENTPIHCNHVTCKTCLDEWTQKSNTCPVCRKNLSTGLEQKFENSQTMQQRFSWPAWEDEIIRIRFPVSPQPEIDYEVHDFGFISSTNTREAELIVSENTTRRDTDSQRIRNIPRNQMFHENEINSLMRSLLPILASHSENQSDNSNTNETRTRRRFSFF